MTDLKGSFLQHPRVMYGRPLRPGFRNLAYSFKMDQAMVTQDSDFEWAFSVDLQSRRF